MNRGIRGLNQFARGNVGKEGGLDLLPSDGSLSMADTPFSSFSSEQ